MVQLFLNPSSLLTAGELVLGLSLPMFVGALIAAFGDELGLLGTIRAKPIASEIDPLTAVVVGFSGPLRRNSIPRLTLPIASMASPAASRVYPNSSLGGANAKL